VVVGPPVVLPDPGVGRVGRRAATEALRQTLQDFLAGVEGRRTLEDGRTDEVIDQ
jgi:hypothetical protein